MGKIDIERIENLTPAQITLLKKRLSFQEGKDQLIAYVIPNKGFQKEEFKEYLNDKLPDYMIPTNVIELADFPKLGNGKIDFNNLPLPVKSNRELSSSSSKEASSIEQSLINIWQEVLDFSPISVDDNFFEIGGDSILSIQIVSKARKLGLKLAPNLIFDYQTISRLATQVDIEDKETSDHREKKIVGRIPLTPIQHWFFEEHVNAPQHWNQSLIINNVSQYQVNFLKQSFELLVKNHDGLRQAFEKVNDQWFSRITEEFSNDLFQVIPFSSESTIDEHLKKVNESFILSDGNLFKVIYFENKNIESCRLVIIAHHLVVDSISWSIILDEVHNLYHQLINNSNLTISNSSFGTWAQVINNEKSLFPFEEDLSFWMSQTANQSIIGTQNKMEPVLENEIRSKTISIDVQNTELLLTSANDAFHTTPFDLMLLALQYALERSIGLESILIGIEKHGRKTVDQKVDLSQTIGWLTSYFPLALTLQKEKGMGDNLSNLKEHIRSIPNDGLSYGALRYLANKPLKQKPELIFNYSGNSSGHKNDPFQFNSLTNHTRSNDSERHHPLEINANIRLNQFELKLDYSPKYFTKEKVEALLFQYEKSLLEILVFCTNQHESQYTSSDFPEANLSTEDLQNLFNQI